MIDRITRPAVEKINSVEFLAPIEYSLTEKVSLFHMKQVPNDTCRLDLYFDAGKVTGEKGIASFVNGVLLSGTEEKTSQEINEVINGLGGYYDSGVSIENAVISIYCLKENLSKIFETLMDAILNVSFIEKEVEEYISDSKQRFKLGLEKVSFLAQRAFQEVLFSNDSRYSKNTELNDYDSLSISDLKRFHQENYVKGLTKVVIVGDVEKNEIDEIIQLCLPICSPKTTEFTGDLKNIAGKKRIAKEGAIQSAIRIGKIMFNKKHEDYLDFIIVNTILGDYFGSRLMSNIREDKGYTYGIGSWMSELSNTGYFIIATEVGHEVKDETIKEIKFEIDRLQRELVPLAELELVQNYMLGQLLKSADGPYAMMDLFLSAETHNEDLDFYNLAIKSVQEITPKRIQNLAIKYLNWESMSIIIAG